MGHDRSKLECPLRIEWLNPSHDEQMDHVLGIERSTSSEPWDKDEFRWLLRHGHLSRVALIGGIPVGFLVYEASRAGRRIVSIAVDPDHHRNGIGTALIDNLKGHMSQVPRLVEIMAYVPESNMAAQLFLRANEFRWTQTIQRGADEGMFIMRCAKPAARAVRRTSRNR